MSRPDWSLEDPPDSVASPWATELRRLDTGLYREPESGMVRSLAAWWDVFARHAERGYPRWSRSPCGRLFIPDGDRFVFLHQESPVAWSTGTAACVGELDGEWLIGSVAFGVARRRGEEWVLGRRAAAVEALVVDVRIPLASQDA